VSRVLAIGLALAALAGCETCCSARRSLAIAKVVFDRVESLKPAGELLGH
jgi:hypothetical protein